MISRHDIPDGCASKRQVPLLPFLPPIKRLHEPVNDPNIEPRTSNFLNLSNLCNLSSRKRPQLQTANYILPPMKRLYEPVNDPNIEPRTSNIKLLEPFETRQTVNPQLQTTNSHSIGIFFPFSFNHSSKFFNSGLSSFEKRTSRMVFSSFSKSR